MSMRSLRYFEEKLLRKKRDSFPIDFVLQTEKVRERESDEQVDSLRTHLKLVYFFLLLSKFRKDVDSNK